MIVKKIKEVVNNNSKKIAYIIEDNSITYEELFNKASTYADYLKRQDSSPVIIYGEKSIDYYIAMISCLIAKRAYIPVSVNTPKERLKDIIKISKSSLMITNNKIELTNIKKCKLEDLINYKFNKIVENNNDIAYIIFTSGSTGIPKGVPIKYSNLFNFATWISSLKPLCNYKNINVLNQANFSFDLSVTDMYYSLFNGHTLISINNDFINNYNEIFDVIKKVDLMVVTPTFMKLCLINKEFNNNYFDRLKCIYFCGETLDKKIVEDLFLRFNDLKIINAYGPTEATSAVTAINITRDMLKYDILPVGDIKNSATEIVIVNNEIVLKGKNVFSGYLNNNNGGYYNENGIDCYKTNDMGYIIDNKLYFKGRMDNQIKYKGYRIELDDIELNIKKIKQVKDCVVVPIYDKDIIKYLKAYVIVSKSINIKKELEKLIPKYMIPKIIIICDELPINDNLKIDRKSLLND